MQPSIANQAAGDLLRISLGVMYLTHSVVLKVLTYGFDGTADYFVSIGLPASLAYLTIAAEAMLAKARWRQVTWRRGTKGPLRAKFAAVRVRVADGPAIRLQGRTGQHLPGDEVWLVGEHRASGERKYYLANLPPDTPLKQLAATIKARWVCEQAHQQLKEELGLDHFEGRFWRGLHRHALLTLIAFLFLQHRRLQAAQRGQRGKKKAMRTASAAQPAGHPIPIARSARAGHASAMSDLPRALPL